MNGTISPQHQGASCFSSRAQSVTPASVLKGLVHQQTTADTLSRFTGTGNHPTLDSHRPGVKQHDVAAEKAALNAAGQALLAVNTFTSAPLAARAQTPQNGRGQHVQVNQQT